MLRRGSAQASVELSSSSGNTSSYSAVGIRNVGTRTRGSLDSSTMYGSVSLILVEDGGLKQSKSDNVSIKFDDVVERLFDWRKK